MASFMARYICLYQLSTSRQAGLSTQCLTALLRHRPAVRPAGSAEKQSNARWSTGLVTLSIVHLPSRCHESNPWSGALCRGGGRCSCHALRRGGLVRQRRDLRRRLAAQLRRHRPQGLAQHAGRRPSRARCRVELLLHFGVAGSKSHRDCNLIAAEARSYAITRHH